MEKAFKTLEKRVREIEEFERKMRALDRRLFYEDWGKKEIQPWEKRVIKDPYYSDHVRLETKVTYDIVFSPFCFDYRSPENFVIKGSGGRIVILGKMFENWDGSWSDPVYEIYAEPLESVEIEYPPDFVGREEIIKDVDSTLRLLASGTLELGEKLYSYLKSGRRVREKIGKVVW